MLLLVCRVFPLFRVRVLPFSRPLKMRRLSSCSPSPSSSSSSFSSFSSSSVRVSPLRPRSSSLLTLFISFLLLSLFTSTLCSGQQIFTRATGPYRRSPSVDDAGVAQVTLRITSPSSLVGTLMMAPAPLGGRVYRVSDADADAGNYDLTYPIVLPHSADGIFSCVPLTRNMTDEGQSIVGSVLLVQRRGGCAYYPKLINPQLAGAAGVIVQNCPECTEGLQRMTVFQPIDLPNSFISYFDGNVLMDYLLARRAAFAAFASNGTPIPSQFSQPLLGTIVGTGKTKESDILALRAIAASMKINNVLSDFSALRDWKDLLDNPSRDPCLDRLVGTWCERGRIQAVWLKYLGISGSLSEKWGELTGLQYLTISENIPESTGLVGAVPDSFCQLSSLFSLQLESNALTSLPNCLGGTGMAQMVSLLVDRNSITNLPASVAGWASNMVWLTASANRITNFPSSFSSMTKMISLDISNNAQLTAEVSPLDFSSWTQIEIMQIHHMSLSGSFASTAFNNMARLVTLDMSANKITGGLPAFTGCAALKTLDASLNQLSGELPSLNALTKLTKLDLSSNRFSGPLPDLLGVTSLLTLGLGSNEFSGGIPSNWRLLTGITTLKLNNNKLSQPVAALGLMPNVEILDLSRNELVTTPGSNNDVGFTLDSMASPKLRELYVDYNKLNGTWSQGRLKAAVNLQKLSMTNNFLQRLPVDIWATYLTYLYVSNNTLGGTIPADINSQTEKSFVTDFYFTGNPGLTAWPLPSWLKFTEPSVYVPSADEIYECRSLSSPTSRNLILKNDPSFTLFNGCKCATGRFGKAPICDFVPVNANIYPAINSLIARSNETAIQAADESVFSSILNGVVDRGNANYEAAMLAMATNTTGKTGTKIRMNPSITDSWYGEQRLTKGLSTYWSLDLSTHRATANGNDEITNATSAQHFTFNTEGPQPVRVITIRLHISSTTFVGPANTIVLYNDTQTRQGTPVLTLNGHEWTSRARPNSSFTLTPEYQLRYNASLSTVQNALVVELPIYSSSFSLYFGSRDSSQTHFVATYTYGYSCPEPLVVRKTKTDETYRCREPIPPLEEYEIPLRIAVYVMVGLSLAFILLQALTLALKWNSPIYRAASRLFVSMILLFLAAMAAGAIQYALEADLNSSEPGICIGRAWLSALPLAGILAVLLVKTWRLYKIFCSTKIMKVTNASDSDLMRTIGIICSLEIVLLVVFSAMKLSKPEESTLGLKDNPSTGEVFDHYRVVRCSQEDGFLPWMVVQLAVVFIGMMASTYLSIKTRHIPTAFNESSHIMACCAILLFFFLMIVPLDYWLQDRPEVGVLLQGFGQAFLAFSLTAMLMGPKMFIALSYSDQDQTAMTKEITTGPSSNVSSRGSITGGSSSSNLSTRGSVTTAPVSKAAGSSSALLPKPAERGSLTPVTSAVPKFGTKTTPVTDKPKAAAVRPSFVTKAAGANGTPQSSTMPAKSPSVNPSPAGPQPSTTAGAVTPIASSMGNGNEPPLLAALPPASPSMNSNATSATPASPTIAIHFRVAPTSPTGNGQSSASAPPASPPRSPTLAAINQQNDSALDFVKRLRMRLPQTASAGVRSASPPASPNGHVHASSSSSPEGAAQGAASSSEEMPAFPGSTPTEKQTNGEEGSTSAL